MNALGRVPKLASAYMRRKLHAERKEMKAQILKDAAGYAEVRFDVEHEQMLNVHLLYIYQKLVAELKVARFEGKPYRIALIRATDFMDVKHLLNM
jgi:uncharacterized protein YjhX (UPF0386 family)